MCSGQTQLLASSGLKKALFLELVSQQELAIILPCLASEKNFDSDIGWRVDMLVPAEPYSRVSTMAELMDDAILTVMKFILQMGRMITTRAEAWATTYECFDSRLALLFISHITTLGIRVRTNAKWNS